MKSKKPETKALTAQISGIFRLCTTLEISGCELQPDLFTYSYSSPNAYSLEQVAQVANLGYALIRSGALPIVNLPDSQPHTADFITLLHKWFWQCPLQRARRLKPPLRTPGLFSFMVVGKSR